MVQRTADRDGTMNKSELIVKLAKMTGLTKAKAAQAVDAIFSARHGLIAVELGAGRKVTLPGFGKFSVRKRAARQGRSPATGATIRIPSRAYPSFIQGETLKEKLRGSKRKGRRTRSTGPRFA